MSTLLNKNEGSAIVAPDLDAQGLRFGIVAARWNSAFTEPMLESAINELLANGCSEDEIVVTRVPGTVELTYAAALLSDDEDVDAVIVFGCVIRGDTPHFDYVCQSVTQGVAQLNARGEVPVIFGVLTVDNERQARERVDGSLADKGAEAAQAAIEMARLHEKYLYADV